MLSLIEVLFNTVYMKRGRKHNLNISDLSWHNVFIDYNSELWPLYFPVLIFNKNILKNIFTILWPEC